MSGDVTFAASSDGMVVGNDFRGNSLTLTADVRVYDACNRSMAVSSNAGYLSGSASLSDFATTVQNTDASPATPSGGVWAIERNGAALTVNEFGGAHGKRCLMIVRNTSGGNLTLTMNAVYQGATDLVIPTLKTWMQEFVRVKNASNGVDCVAVAAATVWSW